VAGALARLRQREAQLADAFQRDRGHRHGAGRWPLNEVSCWIALGRFV